MKEFKELEAIIPSLSQDDYQRLKSSIQKKGIQLPIQILPDGSIIDGFHRFKIAEELGIKDIPHVIKSMDKEEAINLGITLNLNRRHLSYEQKKEIIEKLKEKKWTDKKISKSIHISEGSISNIRKGSNLKDEETSPPDLRYKIDKQDEKIISQKAENRTHQQIASDYGISRRRVGQIVTKVKARQRKPEPIKEITQPKDKKYKTIIIDPPWPVKKIERDERPKQGIDLDYPIMSIEEIKTMAIQKWADPNGCHIYLWTTHKFLPIAFKVFEEWGVKYQCLLTWVKNVGFTPFSWMYSTEHILFGRIGSLALLRNGIRLDFNAKVREHSRKPDEFYDIVKKVSPEPRLDVFSRERREGFDQYGSEVNKYGL